MDIDGHKVVAEYISPEEEIRSAPALDQNWYSNHVRESQYLLQVKHPFHKRMHTFLAHFSRTQIGVRLINILIYPLLTSCRLLSAMTWRVAQNGAAICVTSYFSGFCLRRIRFPKARSRYQLPMKWSRRGSHPSSSDRP